VIKNIHLVDGDDEPVEGSADKIKGLVLKIRFLKKASAISTCFPRQHPCRLIDNVVIFGFILLTRCAS
jgi:hypothetical protein